MAYIPPHKRHFKDAERPAPAPSELFLPSHSRSSSSSSSRSRSMPVRRKGRNSWRQGGKIVYAAQSISRWFIAPLIDDNDDDGHDGYFLPYAVRLEPISCESYERRNGEKPMVLVCDYFRRGANEISGSFAKSPWVLILKKIQTDLLASFQNVREEMLENELEEVKPSFIARFGKIFFHGCASISLDTFDKSSAIETALHSVKRSFYTNISNSYMEAILDGAIANLDVDFNEEKEYYHIKVFDKSRPNATISCKCSVMKDVGELELCKIELNDVRHLVVDISCLNKDLDLRLMLCSKRILKSLTVEEKHCLNSLIKSATIDPDVKGGLRWPLGKEYLGDRYSVLGIWHTKSKSFKSSSMRLELRDADRFDFKASTGEVTKEVIMRMKGVTKQLKEQILLGNGFHMVKSTIGNSFDETQEPDFMIDVVADDLKLIWEHFLCHGCSFD